MRKNIDNRRQDKRLHLPDLQIKVRANGVSNADFIDCTPVDVSLNGLAFTSKDLMLELLHKIDIRFSVGHKMIEGSAVICHIESQPSGVRYGVLYLDISPSIEESFSIGSLSSSLVKNLAVNMADNAVINSSKNSNEALLKKAQILLFDAIEIFKDRLDNLLRGRLDDQGMSYKLDSLFEFNQQTLSVTVPLKNKNEELVRRTIYPVLTKSRVVYEGDDGAQFASILDLLQELSDTFEWMLSE